GEHNGTFRGNNLAFVAAEEALAYWEDGEFEREIAAKARLMQQSLQRMCEAYPACGGTVRGRGMIQGIAFAEPELAVRLCRAAFERGVIMETSGPRDEVAKLMPPLTIERPLLEEGLRRVEQCLKLLAEHPSDATILAGRT
ncbi:aminotransferase class III-fold pyridoxal phosphate-dependent enzyme, partial [Paenibacillus cisolokensis]